ncbi:MAG: hypothetical protein BMS9Abin20_0758 [Acidimicrobiia bacterium]|nr:MAG: hypothetical protein BMS9Abin20_0758 [Acidimicrobiia bacterium]
MAVAVQEPTTSVDFVAEAVLDVYRAHVEEATHMSLAEFIESPRSVGAIRAIVASDARVVEVVLDADSRIHALCDVAWTVADRGWRCNVLVGLERLGEAHTELRGTPCTLQGWWFDAETVRFASHERP